MWLITLILNLDDTNGDHNMSFNQNSTWIMYFKLKHANLKQFLTCMHILALNSTKPNQLHHAQTNSCSWPLFQFAFTKLQLNIHESTYLEAQFFTNYGQILNWSPNYQASKSNLQSPILSLSLKPASSFLLRVNDQPKMS